VEISGHDASLRHYTYVLPRAGRHRWRAAGGSYCIRAVNHVANAYDSQNGHGLGRVFHDFHWCRWGEVRAGGLCDGRLEGRQSDGRIPGRHIIMREDDTILVEKSLELVKRLIGRNEKTLLTWHDYSRGRPGRSDCGMSAAGPELSGIE